jgi:ectoine hydroxylase-related dioxygenase (phytanoyl-CoA dioxygenase family)
MPNFNLINQNEYKKLFTKNGFFIHKNAFSKKFLSKIIDDLNKAKNVEKYYDKNKKLRRIEKIYNKGESLKKLNKDNLKFLKKTLGKKFTIFKDKFNIKPPGGEGYFAHYDGVYKFLDKNNKIKNGWYEYSNFFVNILIAIDNCSIKNGTIEIANAQKKSFNKLLKDTENNGTPNLTKQKERKNNFKSINLKTGDLVVFQNTCPHRSKKNKSKINRRIIYYTYTLSKYGSKYKNYFNDKAQSKNTTSKSLTGEI